MADIPPEEPAPVSQIIADKIVREEAEALTALATTDSPGVSHALWACRDSRAVHLDVWRLKPDRDLARTVIVDALEAAIAMVQALITRNPADERLLLYARNIDLRRINVLRYAASMSSLLNPLATLEGDMPQGLLDEKEFVSFCQQNSLEIPMEVFRNLVVSPQASTESSAESTPTAV